MVHHLHHGCRELARGHHKSDRRRIGSVGFFNLQVEFHFAIRRAHASGNRQAVRTRTAFRQVLNGL